MFGGQYRVVSTEGAVKNVSIISNSEFFGQAVFAVFLNKL